MTHSEPERFSANSRMRMLAPDFRRYSRIRTSRTNPTIATTCLVDSYRFGSSIALALRYTTYTQRAFQIQSENGVRYDSAYGPQTLYGCLTRSRTYCHVWMLRFRPVSAEN